jgi:hypothetical protein
VQYDIEVGAVNSGGQSPFTSIVNATTLVAAPNVPTGLAAGLSTVAAQALIWTAPTAGAVPTSYSVRYSVHGAGLWSAPVTGITGLGTTITGLTGNTSYDFEVASVNAGGTSAWTGIMTANTTNYKLSEGINPGANSSYMHATGGHAFNVNINTASGDGSCTLPYEVDYAFSTSNTTVPTSGWLVLATGLTSGSAYLYSPGTGQTGYGHTYCGNYITVPATAGTYYIWYQAKDSSGNVQIQYCSIYTVTAT